MIIAITIQKNIVAYDESNTVGRQVDWMIWQHTDRRNRTVVSKTENGPCLIKSN